MKFSICIANKDYGLYLLECLGSLEDQSHRNFSIGFVDDGSSDNSLEIWDEWKAKTRCDIFYESLHEKSFGVPFSRNELLLNLPEDCDYVFYLDSDDWICPSFLSQLDYHLKRNQNPPVARFGETIYRMDHRKYYLSFQVQRNIYTVEDIFYPEYAAGLNLVTSREAVCEIGGYDMDFQNGWEDMDYAARAVRQFGCVNLPLWSYFYRVGKKDSRGMRHVRDVDMTRDLLRLVFEKHPETHKTGYSFFGQRIFPNTIDTFTYNPESQIALLRQS